MSKHTPPVATREAVNHALNLHWWDEDDQPCACGFDFLAAGQSFKMHLTDALLAAGVFREPPTAEQIAMKLSLVRFSDEESDRMIELTMREAWPLADAVLALIGDDAK